MNFLGNPRQFEKGKVSLCNMYGFYQKSENVKGNTYLFINLESIEGCGL